MDTVIIHFLLHKLLWAMLLFVSLPVFLGVIKLAELADAQGDQVVLAWIIRLPLAVVFFVEYWLAGRVSHHITIERIGFWKGVKAGFQDLRLHLAFLPLIGGWFVKNKDKPDDCDDES